VLTVIMLSSILNCEDVTYVIDDEPNTVRFSVIITEPDIV
jgi:hypothetical protein